MKTVIDSFTYFWKKLFMKPHGNCAIHQDFVQQKVTGSCPNGAYFFLESVSQATTTVKDKDHLRQQ